MQPDSRWFAWRRIDHWLIFITFEKQKTGYEYCSTNVCSFYTTDSGENLMFEGMPHSNDKDVDGSNLISFSPFKMRYKGTVRNIFIRD